MASLTSVRLSSPVMKRPLEASRTTVYMRWLSLSPSTSLNFSPRLLVRTYWPILADAEGFGLSFMVQPLHGLNDLCKAYLKRVAGGDRLTAKNILLRSLRRCTRRIVIQISRNHRDVGHR